MEAPVAKKESEPNTLTWCVLELSWWRAVEGDRTTNIGESEPQMLRERGRRGAEPPIRGLQGLDTRHFHQGTPLSVVELLSARCRTCRVQCIPQEARWLVLRLLWAPPYRQWLHPCHHRFGTTTCSGPRCRSGSPGIPAFGSDSAAAAAADISNDVAGAAAGPGPDKC